MERLINLLEMYDIRIIITKDYFVSQSNDDDLLFSMRDDLLKFGHYEYFSKLKVLYFEVLADEKNKD